MDLVYTDTEYHDIGVLHEYSLDLAYGTDENDFELTLPIGHPQKPIPKGLIYVDGSEYGGIINTFEADTTDTRLPVVRYLGSTWQGILDDRVIRPAAGEDYYIISGDAHACLAELIDHFELTDLFAVPIGPSGIIINEYQFARYVSGYKGIGAMLKTKNAKLVVTWTGEKAVLHAEPIADYTSEEFDSDQISFKVNKAYRPYNHICAMGKGDLKERKIVDLYADADGNISETQTFFGIDKRTYIYDLSSAEDDELATDAEKKLKELLNQDTCEVSVPPTRLRDIGDLCAARNEDAGIDITAEVTKKIITLTETREIISYEVGPVTQSASST